MKSSKLFALAGLLAASALGTGAALGATSSTPLGFTLANWINTGYVTSDVPGSPAAAATVVLNQDKIWTFISQSGLVAANTSIKISTVTDSPIPTVDTHQLVVSNLSDTAAPWGATLRYSIAIDLAQTPLGVFRNASVGVDVPNGNIGVTVDKRYYSDAFVTQLLPTLTVTNGGGAGPTVSVVGLTKLWVEEVFTVGVGGILNSVSNTYTELTQGVPEPATLTLFGLGLAGLGARARSRARQARS